MNIGLLIGLLLGALIFIPLLIWYVWWEISFNLKVQIFKQVGKDSNDVIRVQDRFKVRQKNGVYTIIFRNQLSNTPSPPYMYWTKYLGKSKEYTEEQWKTLDLSRQIKRGLMLYQGTEGDYRPIEFVKDATGVEKAKILSQDNRRWVMSKLREEAEFTLSKKQQLIIYGGIIIAFIILAVVFVMFLIYLSENAQNVCAFGQSTTGQFIQTVQGAVGG